MHDTYVDDTSAWRAPHIQSIEYRATRWRTSRALAAVRDDASLHTSLLSQAFNRMAGRDWRARPCYYSLSGLRLEPGSSLGLARHASRSVSDLR